MLERNAVAQGVRRCVGTRRDGRVWLVGGIGTLPLLLDETSGTRMLLLLNVLRRWSVVQWFWMAMLHVEWICQKYRS